MLKFACAAGALDEKAAALEAALCIRRAGADAIITYYAEELDPMDRRLKSHKPLRHFLLVLALVLFLELGTVQ